MTDHKLLAVMLVVAVTAATVSGGSVVALLADTERGVFHISAEITGNAPATAGNAASGPAAGVAGNAPAGDAGAGAANAANAPAGDAAAILAPGPMDRQARRAEAAG